MPHLRALECEELCSPFLGGGSIELTCAEEGMIVHGYDLFQPLVWFWEALLSNPTKLLSHIEGYRENVRGYTSPQIFANEWGKKCSTKCLMTKDSDTLCNNHTKLASIWSDDVLGASKKNFEIVRELVNSRTSVSGQTKLFEAAAQYYIVNRTSFSGATTSGGWSWKASWARLTQNTLENLGAFSVNNFTVQRKDFQQAIESHPSAALYLDPPYCLNKEKVLSPGNRETLYGSDGDHHEGFDHEGLSNILKSRDKWVLSYNDCEYIRDLYDGYKIIDAEWSYGMNKSKESSEIIIVG
jgi:DNA adenine methylase